MNKTSSILFVLLILVVTVPSSVFIVREGNQAIITEFGKPIGMPITEAGLHFKKPFIQEISYVDKKILTWDGYPNQIPTKDKKYIKVDTTARWKITNALKFIQSVRNLHGARARLDAILDSSTRDVVSNHNLVEIVRNSNQILEKKRKQSGSKEVVFGELKAIQIGREKLSQLVVNSAKSELQEFGIKLIDLQIRRISYENSVEQKVYDRMISERQRIAQKIRSEGEGEKQKIQGRIKMDLQKINSEAYKVSKIIKGKAEAKVIKIYANAYKKAPRFYAFLKSLEAYKTSLKGKTKLILSTDSKFFEYLKGY